MLSLRIVFFGLLKSRGRKIPLGISGIDRLSQWEMKNVKHLLENAGSIF